jgi:hypothetical protein
MVGEERGVIDCYLPHRRSDGAPAARGGRVERRNARLTAAQRRFDGLSVSETCFGVHPAG